MGKLLSEKNLRDVWCRNESVRGQSGLERWTGDRTVRGSNPTAENFSLRNFGNSVYPALPVSFGGDTKSRRSRLCGGKRCPALKKKKKKKIVKFCKHTHTHTRLN